MPAPVADKLDLRNALVVGKDIRHRRIELIQDSAGVRDTGNSLIGPGDARKRGSPGNPEQSGQKQTSIH